MSNLCFVRHAQASLFKEDYDQLSDRGERQARKLGDFFVRHRVKYDAVYCGPRLRHRQTADIVGQLAGAALGTWPRAIQLDGLDEHHVDQLVVKHVDEIAAMFPQVQQCAISFQSATENDERQRTFQRLFESVARLWITRECDDFGMETWLQFSQRVNEAISRIVHDASRSSNVLVFTSVGPITVALQRALQCCDEVAMSTGWRVWNCSLTEFAFSGERFTLDRFNALPHLPDRNQWTYR